MTIIASLDDFRIAARRRLPRFLFDYADGGAFSEITCRRNVDDLHATVLRQRVLQDVASIDLRTTLFGHEQPLPVALGPVGIAGMFRRRGETQAARGAHRHGVPFTLSTVGICGMTELRAAASDGPLWFQLYVIRDRGFMRDLLARAKEAGAQALVFTVDMPTPGIRYRDAHSGMSGPGAGVKRLMQAMGKPGWAWDVGVHGRPHRLGNLEPVLGAASGLNDYMGWLGANFDPGIRWKDLDWLRAEWDGPLVIKGVLDPEDARAAADYGADGIVVSNHGGRQLDGAMSTAAALPRIAAAVGDRLTVLADSGVRSGLDVVRLLALGAKGVLLGRAWLWALAAEGEDGVARMLSILAREMEVVMTLTGVNAVSAIDHRLLAEVSNPFPTKEQP
ncbi:FMN-dependent L-lactate dehydrogenase LldD [Brevundimonas sp. SORGH_AS_0993]|uniref:FMN-dependent L-lactate dehydrogenase LldD n=1 Tax=Brevundimonas sp. SORGH_AS_0993 TaxID=3041794 RepID=UPI00277EBE62|nr:FMN-dependent L-lactate dehydrogenase LldD [Brevundimonas sp. SORGH_AS_0993]MDQ1155158.1 L-lactate dehydrogenase (cytochrome) [Brevundimonas sp. SORGH_AS_0993]